VLGSTLPARVRLVEAKASPDLALCGASISLYFLQKQQPLRCVVPWNDDRPCRRLGAYSLFPNTPAMLRCPYAWHGHAAVMVRGSWDAFLGSATGQRGELGKTLCLCVPLRWV